MGASAMGQGGVGLGVDWGAIPLFKSLNSATSFWGFEQVNETL